MPEYIFSNQDSERELARLQMLEKAVDSKTVELLKKVPLSAGAKCMELGPGAGSIMQWMGHAVGSTGQVIGIDKDAQHLRRFRDDPRYEIVDGDFLEAELWTPFDLVHCRYVLIHNRKNRQMLSKICRLIKPGGFLLIEEPDFTSARLLNRPDDVARQHVNNAICRMFETKQLDPGFGLRLPAFVEDENMKTLDVHGQIHIARGGSVMAQMMAASQNALADQHIETGEVLAAEIEQYVYAAGDPCSWAVYYSTISVLATRPSVEA